MFSTLRCLDINCSKVLIISKRYLGRPSLGIIGVPFEKGQRREGAGDGPEVLRKAGLIEELRKSYCKVEDYGDCGYEPLKLSTTVRNMHDLDHVAACQKVLSEKVTKVIKDGKKVLTIGGDHSLAIGTIDGHIKAKRNVGVLWVDAHPDLNTSETSPSGNVHGMCMALLTKELADYWPVLPGMDWQWPEMSLRNIAYIGLRDIDVYERRIIEKFQIAAFGMEEVERKGIALVIQEALHRIDPRSNRSIHISFDIDALDPLEAPSTGTPVRGGLLLREGIQIIEACYKTNRLGAVDVVEFNPKIGEKQDVHRTAAAAIMLCKAVTGYSRSGTHHSDDYDDIPMPGNNNSSESDKK